MTRALSDMSPSERMIAAADAAQDGDDGAPAPPFLVVALVSTLFGLGVGLMTLSTVAGVAAGVLPIAVSGVLGARRNRQAATAADHELSVSEIAQRRKSETAEATLRSGGTVRLR